jgi:hypothetical protein
LLLAACAVLLACNAEEREHCEDNKIVKCEGSSHQPDIGCSDNTVKHCDDYDGVCVDTAGGPLCVEPERTCADEQFSFCEDNAVRVCRYGHVTADEITKCSVEQPCQERMERSERIHFCAFWPASCVEGERRCYSSTVAVSCGWQGNWSERTYCEPGTRCDDGECRLDDDDEDAGAP